MPQAALAFQLPEEEDQLRHATAGLRYWRVLTRLDAALEGAGKETYEARQLLWALLCDEGVSLVQS